MTTPEPDTPDTTPTYFQEGDTPYQGVIDPEKGSPGFIFLSSLETRKIRDSSKSRLGIPAATREWNQYLRELIENASLVPPGTYFFSYFAHPTWEGIDRASGKYYGYDFGVYDDPVNQVPDTREWLTHIATFAHEIETLWSPDSLLLRHPDNYNMVPGSGVRTSEHNLRNQTALRYARGICGFAFDRVTQWAKLDPTETRWRTQRAGVLEDVEALCLICEHAHWLRQFTMKHDIIPWANALASPETAANGQQYYRVPKIDKTSEPWQPSTENVTTVAGNAPLNWWKRQMENYGKAVDWYDDNLGRRET